MRILFVEDDSATAQTVELMLKSEGFNIFTTDLGEEAVELGKLYDYDLILLDLKLRDISGFDVLRKLRVAKIQTPVIVLTGSTDIETQVKCFGTGADDFINKPFHKDVLVARMHAVIRRSKGHTQAVITVGKLAVNLDARSVELGGKHLKLTGKEYAILELLALRLNSVVAKDMVLNHVYGGMDEPQLKIIDVFISKLRKKIAARNDGEHYIETAWGRGYRLSTPHDAAARPAFEPGLAAAE